MKKYVIITFITALLAGLAVISFAADQTVPLPDLMKPQSLTVDHDQLYITENTTIYIYSLKDFKLKAKFGKAGEGPGEFRDIGFGVKLEPVADALIVYSPGRVSHFSRGGKFIKEKQITDPRKGQFKRLGDNYVGTSMNRENQKVWFVLNLYDAQLKVLKKLHKYEHPFFPKTKKINPLDVRVCSYYVYDKKIFVDDAEGNINIFDAEGKKTAVIKPSYQTINVPAARKKHYTDLWKINHKAEYEAFKTRLQFPSTYPRIRNFHVMDNRVFILTYKEKAGKSEMLVYSPAGKLLKTVSVPLADLDMLLPNLYNYYTIKAGKIYKLVENLDDETWELHISAIE